MQNVCTDIPRTCICVPQGCFLVDCSKEGGGEIFWLAVGGGGTGGNCPSFIKEIRWSSQKCFSPAASVFENSTYLSGPTNPSFFFLGLITFLSERKLSMFKDFASVSQWRALSLLDGRKHDDLPVHPADRNYPGRINARSITHLFDQSDQKLNPLRSDPPLQKKDEKHILPVTHNLTARKMKACEPEYHHWCPRTKTYATAWVPSKTMFCNFEWKQE